jgi:hypothetical protein
MDNNFDIYIKNIKNMIFNINKEKKLIFPDIGPTGYGC